MLFYGQPSAVATQVLQVGKHGFADVPGIRYGFPAVFAFYGLDKTGISTEMIPPLI